MAGIPVVFCIVAWVIASFFGPKIKEMAVQQINSYLTVPVNVQGIDFSLLRKFPYASVDFAEVSTDGAKTTFRQEPLLVARHVYLQFSWWDIFSDRLRVKKISVEDATCALLVDENKQRNFDIFKKNTSEENGFKLELEEILLKNTGIRYYSHSGKSDYSFRAADMKLKGVFSDAIYDVAGNGQLFVERLRVKDVNYIDHKEVGLKLAIHIDSKLGRYDIRESSLRVSELELGIGGFIVDQPGKTAVDLKIASKDAGLQELLSLIPGVYTEKLNQYNYEGNVYFHLRISGNVSDREQPQVTASFGTENASLSPAGTAYKLNKIRFKGSYTNRLTPNRPVERLMLNGVEALLDGQPFSGSMVLEDFSNPFIYVTALSKINLQVLSRFYLPDTLQEMNGSLLVNATVKGRVRESAGWISQGSVEAVDVSFRLKGSDISFAGFNGKVTLLGNRLNLMNLSGKAAGSDFNINGNFDNVYACLLSPEAVLTGAATLVSKNLDLNELLEDQGAGSAADTTYRLDFSKRLKLNLGLNIGLLSFRKFQAWQLKGTIDLRDKVLSTDAISFKAFEGNLKLQGRMDAARTDSVLIACDVDVQQLDVTELFSQLGNFGQEVIRDVNVKGKLTANVQFASTWSKDLHCNLNKVYAKSKLLIEKGELINFQPMLVLSRYLKSADLNQVKFETLQNEIEISNKTITIPAMEIKSSVMDLTASGTHTFDNIVNYKLQLYLSQLFGKKVRNNSTEFGTIEDDGLGRMRLFLTMKGPLVNPVIVYDRQGIEQKIARDIKQEKQDLKKILHKEFGWFKKDTTLVKHPDNQPEKKDELELELDPD